MIPRKATVLGLNVNRATLVRPKVSSTQGEHESVNHGHSSGNSGCSHDKKKHNCGQRDPYENSNTAINMDVAAAPESREARGRQKGVSRSVRSKSRI